MTMRCSRITSDERGEGGVWARRVGLLMLCLLVFGLTRDGTARVRPYYVLQGASFGQIEPRILFVLDTSGSMAWRATAPLSGFWGCEWAECETTEGTSESRISAARRAMRSVIDSSEAASFGLMTFEQPRPPSSVPPHCSGAPGTRFTWASEYFAFPRALGWSTPAPIEAHPGVDGMWRLCEGEVKRPYPYLRWDELGTGAVAVGQHELGEVPPSPLLLPDSGTFDDPANASRRVQWFPRFMGVRVHLEDVEADNEVLAQTVGDYADDPAERAANVRGHDFYYWPYVDGFPGYGHFSTTPYSWATPGEGAAGVASMSPADVDEAQLYAPFYLDLDDVVEVPADARGPASLEHSRAQVQGATAPIIEGGVDAGGYTPWASAIGDVPAIPATTYDNRPFSHSTVASYLRFVTTAAGSDRCAPTSVVLLTDGEPYPAATEGGSLLYNRLSALRNELGVPTYVVGFFTDAHSINEMACAANGSCNGGWCNNPCEGVSANDWDTCADPSDPVGGCAYLASSTEELQAVFGEIIDDAIDLELPSGPGSSVNDFGVGATGEPGSGQTLQTKFGASTQWPGWRGHVTRSACEDRYADDHPENPGELMPHCVAPVPEFEPEELRPTFGPCPQSRTWDAGECLQATTWHERRVYTNVYDPAPGGATPRHRMIRISDDDGSASGEFVAVLGARGLLTGPDPQVEADEIVSFILGEDAPEGWKLPGLASSAPVVVRRIPPRRADRVPEVSIRDPHCAGRVLGDLGAGALPNSLLEFADDAWSAEGLLGSAGEEHHEYQEAVLVGDDMGMLHAFGLDSGNELFGFIPQFALETTVAQSRIGAATMGQPEDLEDHLYGLSSTLNHGWVFDDTGGTSRWRHLGVIGMGAGGTEYVAFDLSHMSPQSPRDPIEVLWTSEDPEVSERYSDYNGETWARPALTYHVPGDQITSVPQAFVMLGGGYPDEGEPGDPEPPAEQGRTLMRVDALTGEILEAAVLPDIVTDVYEEDFGALVDPAVGSHCLSRMWSEMQEVYVADPAGRLFRWDQGRDTAHTADSGGPWGLEAQPVFTFSACEGGSSCTVDVGNPADVFVFGPAVSANDRIDDASAAAGEPPAGVDQFLVAMVSGSPYEDTLDPTTAEGEYHSSLYLLVDDHQVGDPGQGFDIPVGGGKAEPGDSASYMRIALSDIERTRTVVPYPGGPVLEETRNFSRSARPVRPPRIFVTGVVTDDGVPVDDLEVYSISYTIYEPGSGECNEDFYDAATDTWYFDRGSTYEVTLRLTADSTSGFDFIGGSTNGSVVFPDGFSRGLELTEVRQVTETSRCSGGGCGPAPGAPAPAPCDNDSASAPSPGSFALTVRHAAQPGFTPIE